jgi:pilus assembly protein CpaB
MPRRTMLVISAILLAALGTSLVWLYVQGADSRAAAGTRLVYVLRLTRPAAAGTPVGQLALGTSALPAAEQRGALGAVDTSAGLVLRDAAVAGQLLYPAMLAEHKAATLDPTHVAVSLSVRDDRRVPALLAPNQDVAVYAVSPAGGRHRVVLARVRVLTVGDRAAAGTDVQGQAPGQIVTFDVAPPDAGKLIDIPPSDVVTLAILGDAARVRR